MFGLFKKKETFIDPKEYVIVTRQGDYIYILDKFIRDKVALDNLRSLVCPSVPSGKANLLMLVKSAKFVLDEASKRLDKYVATMKKTEDPEEFFNCVWCIKRDIEAMAAIERYVYYGTNPSDMYSYQLNQRLQIEIRHLIDRAYKSASVKPDFDIIRNEHIRVFKESIRTLDDKSLEKFRKKYKPDDC